MADAAGGPTKTGPTEKVMFNVGYGRASVEAGQLISTSGVPLANEKRVLVEGKEVSCGYYSNSSLESWTRCAKQFEFRYVKKERGRLLPKLKMWGGTSVHDATEKLLTAKLRGKTLTPTEYLQEVEDGLTDTLAGYQNDYKKAKKEKYNPMELDFGERIIHEANYKSLYTRAAQLFYDQELPKIKPVAVEDMFIHHFDVHSGGTVPLVGFIDLIEIVDGKHMITDHKVGAKKVQSEVDINMQLSLYSMVKKVPDTSINNFVLGTTGGKSGKNPKPGEILKFRSKRTIRDYERVSNNINEVLKGIKAGAFPRSGIHNPIVCAPSQCPFYAKCLGKS